MMQTTTLWAVPTDTHHRLSTKEGFSKAVAVKSRAAGFAGAALAIALVLLAYNFLSSIKSIFDSSLGWEFSDILTLMTVTTGLSGSTDPLLVAYVWGPVVLIPVAVVLFVIAGMTRVRRVDSAYTAFQNGGYVARGVSLPFSYEVNNLKLVPQVIVPQEYASPEVEQWFNGLVQTLSNLDKKGLKALAKTLISRANAVEVAIPASLVFPDAPPFVLLSPTLQKTNQMTARAVLPGEKRTMAYIVKEI